MSPPNDRSRPGEGGFEKVSDAATETHLRTIARRIDRATRVRAALQPRTELEYLERTGWGPYAAEDYADDGGAS